ncbi:hypothetical protein [Nostoc sp. 106C]|uniref:hypothetical protein n=1 Tax=Nostoc sp. 106C TaxID=1932667 RepID=UPI000A381AAE|nr:hypothetical protein [Nostoc sp. 106C]OUL32714.1 hypothetical protein BV375_08660 [Nostoc sp. 106C]
MFSSRIRSDEEYLKPNCLIKAVSKSITGQHQAIGVNWQKEINFIKYSFEQPSSSAKWHKSESLPVDVETGAVNGYIDYLIKNLNKYRNFSQILKCDFSYFNSLSKLKLPYIDSGSLTKSTQDCLQQLTVNKLSNYKRYKINVGGTEKVLQHFPTDIVEILLTGNRFNKNECYKVAT